MASNVQREATKRPGRSRWNANPQQLQTLESIFEQGNGNTPNKPRIKDIAVELSQYGPISDTNVYNWFQNRKARAKRKLQHQLDLKEEGTKTGEDEDVASPSAKRFKGEGDLLVQNEAMSCLEPHSHLGAKSSSAGGIERVLTDDLRLHVDFATLATDPQLPSVDPATDMLFSDHGFHEQVAGTTDPSSPLQEISVEVKEWDVRNSYGESSNMVDSQTSYLPSHDVDNFNCLSGLAGDKYLISLAGGPVPSVEEFRKGAAETRGLKTEEAITAAASETCV